MHEWQYIKNLIAMNNFADITLLESCIIKRDILTIIRHEALNIHILYHADCYRLGASKKREKSVSARANFFIPAKKKSRQKEGALAKNGLHVCRTIFTTSAAFLLASRVKKVTCVTQRFFWR
jgi:hypothetical protein